jgi:hypothetical protein
VINSAGIVAVDVRESKGSNENLAAVEAGTSVIGTAFLGSVHQAITGTGFTNGTRFTSIRALFPMYETAFMTAALKASGITSVKQLNGKKVGAGPERGPAEGYFRALAEETQIAPMVVSGTPSEQAQQLIRGEIDALWQGASVPIPSIAEVTKGAEAIVFGMNSFELARMRTRFAFMSEMLVPAETYRGQTSDVRTMAAWNVVVANRALPSEVAYAVTKAVLGTPDLADVAGLAARSTTARNAPVNTVLPYHPGAAQAIKELGVEVLSEA